MLLRELIRLLPNAHGTAHRFETSSHALDKDQDIDNHTKCNGFLFHECDEQLDAMQALDCSEILSNPKSIV